MSATIVAFGRKGGLKRGKAAAKMTGLRLQEWPPQCSEKSLKMVLGYPQISAG